LQNNNPSFDKHNNFMAREKEERKAGRNVGCEKYRER
jgi:hypothetical protein